MSLWSWIKGMLPQMYGTRDANLWPASFRRSNLSEAGETIDRDAALGVSPIWRAVNLISSDVAKLPLHIYEREGEHGRKRAVTHPAYKILRYNPNMKCTAGVFRKTLTAHAMLTGNGYALIDREGLRIKGMYLLNPDKVDAVEDEDGSLHYIHRDGSEHRKFPAKDIFHLKGLGFDGLSGYSMINLLKDSIGIGVAQTKFVAGWYGRGLITSGFLKFTGTGRLSEAEQKDILENWERMKEGVDNNFKLGFMPSDLDYIPFQSNAEEAQLIDTRRFSLIEAALVTGVPPHKLGADFNSSYNSLEQENKAYLQDALDPWLCAWEEECRDKLLSERSKDRDSHFVEFKREAIEQTDMKTKIETLVEQLNNGILNQDEVRSILNLPKTPDENGQRYRMPVNIAFVDMIDTLEEREELDHTDASMEAISEVVYRFAVEGKKRILDRCEKTEFIDWMEGHCRTATTRLKNDLLPVMKLHLSILGGSQDGVAEHLAEKLAVNYSESINMTVQTLVDNCTRKTIREELTKMINPEQLATDAAACLDKNIGEN